MGLGSEKAVPARARELEERGVVHELDFMVVAASSSSEPYLPERILDDNPYDSTSRWSTETKTSGDAWILLKVKNPSILASITFGKYYKPHPCNLREFEVWIGPSEDRMSLAIQEQLQDNDEPERVGLFNSKLRAWNDGPCQFVKIVPLSAHMPKYNVSIWNVVLRGIDDPKHIQRLADGLLGLKEEEAMQLVMKFLRQRGLDNVSRDLQKATTKPLEDPLVSRLYDAVVTQMDYEAAESILEEIAAVGKSSLFVSESSSCAVWSRLDKLRQFHNGYAPGNRIGHTMCFVHTSEGRQIYLLGGWNGSRELPDFWAFDIDRQEWDVLSLHTQADDGPGSRVGHAMAFDRRTNSIFVLGRYVDVERDAEKHRTEESKEHRYPSDFFRYRLAGKGRGSWEKLSVDTQAEGGPGLLHGHRVVIDSDSQRLYVYGGEVVSQKRGRQYSGLYCYDIAARTWTMLFDDKIRGGPIFSRAGHNMHLIDTAPRKLVIFGGSRAGAPLTDCLFVDLLSGGEEHLCKILPDFGPPVKGYQRSTTDRRIRQLFVFVEQSLANSVPSVWCHTVGGLEWERLETNIAEDVASQASAKTVLPTSRHATRSFSTFDVGYDEEAKQHFVFGGLSDRGASGLWTMTPRESSTANEAVRRCRFILRRQCFLELCRSTSDIQTTLSFLRDVIHPTVNMDNEAETDAYHSLMKHILLPNYEEDTVTFPLGNRPARDLEDVKNPTLFKQRMAVFEELMQFINPSMRQPDGDLMDRLF